MLRCVQLLQAGPQRRLGRLRRPVVYAPCLPAVFLPSPCCWMDRSCSPDKQTAKAERKPSTRTQGCGLDYSLHRRPHRRSSVRATASRHGAPLLAFSFPHHTLACLVVSRRSPATATAPFLRGEKSLESRPLLVATGANLAFVSARSFENGGNSR